MLLLASILYLFGGSFGSDAEASGIIAELDWWGEGDGGQQWLRVMEGGSCVMKKAECNK
jgi:hypothetical protein